VSLNQLAILKEVPNSYLLSLQLSDEMLELFDCKSIDLDYGIGDWITLAVYKKSAVLTELEKQFLELI
jgi:hypothetical protein